MTKKDKTDKVVRVISRTHVPRDRVNRKKRQDIKEKKPETKEDKPIITEDKKDITSKSQKFEDKTSKISDIETEDQNTHKYLKKQINTSEQKTTPKKEITEDKQPETEEEPDNIVEPDVKEESPQYKEQKPDIPKKDPDQEKDAETVIPEIVKDKVDLEDKSVSDEQETDKEKTYKDLIKQIRSKDQKSQKQEKPDPKKQHPRAILEELKKQTDNQKESSEDIGEKPYIEEDSPNDKEEKPYEDFVEKVDEKNQNDKNKLESIKKSSESLNEPIEKSLDEPVGKDKPHKRRNIFYLLMVICIVLVISATAYSMMIPKKADNYTDFYLLSSDGKSINNTMNLVPNQEGKLIIGVVNHEYNKTAYHLVVTSNGTLQYEQNLTLDVGQKLEIPFNFTAGEPGERKMEFKLYKTSNNTNIYRYLYLWLNITESSGEITE